MQRKRVIDAYWTLAVGSLLAQVEGLLKMLEKVSELVQEDFG